MRKAIKPLLNYEFIHNDLRVSKTSSTELIAEISGSSSRKVMMVLTQSILKLPTKGLLTSMTEEVVSPLREMHLLSIIWLGLQCRRQRMKNQ